MEKLSREQHTPPHSTVNILYMYLINVHHTKNDVCLELFYQWMPYH